MSVKSVLVLLLIVDALWAENSKNLSDWEDIPTETGAISRCALELLPTGVAYGTVLPGRAASLHCQVAGMLSVRAEPVVGYKTVKGFGGSVGFLIGDPALLFDGNRFGVRYVYFTLEDTDPVHEIMLQWIRTYTFAGNWIWHYGAAMGLGLSEYQEHDEYGDPVVESGFTYRIELGVGRILF